MSGYFELGYEIDGKHYLECKLRSSGAIYCLDGAFYTQEGLKNISSTWGTWYHTDNDHHYRKGYLDSVLSMMSPDPNSTWVSAAGTLTRKELEEIVKLYPPTLDPPDATAKYQDASTQEPDDPKTTPAALPRAIEDGEEEEDELVTKLLANMQARMEAIKGHKKLVAEVEKLRELLAEKEAVLVESEKAMALEVRLAKAD